MTILYRHGTRMSHSGDSKQKTGHHDCLGGTSCCMGRSGSSQRLRRNGPASSKHQNKTDGKQRWKAQWARLPLPNYPSIDAEKTAPPSIPSRPHLQRFETVF
jgi:hypothetical protein